MFAHMKLGTKVGGLVGLACLLLIIAGSTAFIGMNKVSHDLNVVVDEKMATLQTVARVAEANQVIAGMTNGLLLPRC